MAPSGGGAVKRGRGRPPGTRNKATLMAQAKLLSQQQSNVKPATDGPKGRPLPVSSTNRVTARTNTTRSQSWSDSPCCFQKARRWGDRHGKNIRSQFFTCKIIIHDLITILFTERTKLAKVPSKTDFKCAVLQKHRNIQSVNMVL